MTFCDHFGFLDICSNCVPKGKPGMCPRRRWGMGICAEFCSNDSDCPNDENCCHNGCGHVCIAPYTGPSRRTH
uniref:WAP domain-containing protein n=1 Tax=Salmo trutta TaxID=8032 RepID=A0A674CP48_SALTR